MGAAAYGGRGFKGKGKGPIGAASGRQQHNQMSCQLPLPAACTGRGMNLSSQIAPNRRGFQERLQRRLLLVRTAVGGATKWWQGCWGRAEASNISQDGQKAMKAVRQARPEPNARTPQADHSRPCTAGLPPPHPLSPPLATGGRSPGQPPTTANRHQPPITNRHQPPIATNRQPPIATNHS